MIDHFYDDLASRYHLIYEDWDASVRRQGAQLDAIIRGEWGTRARTILDAAAGIGTQTLALAALGYDITASDRSLDALARCRREAAARSLEFRGMIADFRALAAADRRFDVVIACDNALPHLLSDDDLLVALRELLRCTVPGGGCVISMRDYPESPPTGAQLQPFGVREVDGRRFAVYQIWTWDGPCYDLAMYITEDTGGDECPTRVFRSRYYAVPVVRMLTLMHAAGFEHVRRLDGVYFQPILVGTRPQTG